jgi:hypothetical protein
LFFDSLQGPAGRFVAEGPRNLSVHIIGSIPELWLSLPGTGTACAGHGSFRADAVLFFPKGTRIIPKFRKSERLAGIFLHFL